MIKFISALSKCLIYVYLSIFLGCATTLNCILNPNITSGEFYANCDIKRNEQHPKALDEDLAKKLWAVSEKIINEVFIGTSN